MTINIKQIIKEVINEVNNSKKDKITRDTFLYFEPKEPKNKFAQCSTCNMFTGNSCLILGKEKITGNMSCNFYMHGKPPLDSKGKEKNEFTPKEVGLVNRQVRCENCRSFDVKNSTCKLYQLLNKSSGDIFQLEEKVNPYGCCNAQKPI